MLLSVMFDATLFSVKEKEGEYGLAIVLIH